LNDALKDPLAFSRGLGEYMTEPKPNVWFTAKNGLTESALVGAALQLDRRTRMMFDANHIFINGESFHASGRDAVAMRQLANERLLDARQAQRLSAQAHVLMLTWVRAGWLHVK